MKSLYKVLGIGALALALPAMAFASANLTHLTLDGATNATVEEGGSVDGKVTFDITSSTDVESLSWELVGSGLPQTCVNTADRIANGTFTSTFEIDTTGASEGTWDVLIKLYGDDDANVSNLCENTDQVDGQQFNDRITVTDQTDDNQADNDNVGSSGKPSWLDDFLAAIAAMLKPAAPVEPVAPAYCKTLVTYNGMNAMAAQASLLATPHASFFHAAGVYAPTGYWGSISTQAQSAAVAACN